MNNFKFYLSSLTFIIFIFMICSWTFAQSDTKTVTAPGQPAYGPGGADYIFSGYTKTSYGVGAHKFWIYEPRSPKPASAPVIVFIHGWSAIYPELYEGWIKHLVKKGNIVIYPQYQDGPLTPSNEFTPNTIQAVKEALIQLNNGDHIKPELDKFAVVGHSAGGIISINIASLASSQGLPQPKAVFCVEPGTDESRKNGSLENLSKVPSNTLVLALSGDKDEIVGSEFAQTIIRNTSQVPRENKDYVILVSDDHGKPILSADHLAPLSIRIQLFDIDLTFFTNTLDYYGTWKLFDGLYDAAFHNKNREYALGNTSQQRFMGVWSDGTLVKELIVNNNP